MKVLLLLIATACCVHFINCQEFSGDDESFNSEEFDNDIPSKERNDCSNLALVDYDFSSLPLEDCGTGFLRNGDVAELDSFPWITQFVYRNAYYKEVVFCGGALISKRYVLTSATCAIGYPSTFKLIRVRFSDVNSITNPDCLSDNEEICARYVDVPVEELIPHKEYNVIQKNHDVALVRLRRDLSFSEFIRPICLPLENINFKEHKLIVAGFGRPSPVPRTHMSIGYTRMMERQECLASLARVFQYRDSTSVKNGSQFCAGPGSQSCFADSGGPLMVNLGSHCPLTEFKYVIVGIDSLCGTTRTRPGLYTDVQIYMPWILNTLLGNHIKPI